MQPITDDQRWQLWQQRLEARNIPIRIEPLTDARGKCATSWIEIRDDLAPEQAMLTCVHELAHWVLHVGPQLDLIEPDRPRQVLTDWQMEWEAEAVVRLYCLYKGIQLFDGRLRHFNKSSDDLFRPYSRSWYEKRVRLAIEKVMDIVGE